MTRSEKPLCKLNKDQLAKLLPQLAAEAHQVRYLCRKCARAAISPQRLCKPVSLEKLAGKQKG